MNKDHRQTVSSLMNQFEGVSLEEESGGKFWFKIHIPNNMRDASIDALDLSVRSYNCLKRAGIDTVGDVANAVTGGRNLKGIRNCGAKSVREIMERLFMFQCNLMPIEKQEEYLVEVIQLNQEKKGNVLTTGDVKQIERKQLCC